MFLLVLWLVLIVGWVLVLLFLLMFEKNMNSFNPNRVIRPPYAHSLSVFGFPNASFLLPASWRPLRLDVVRYAFDKGGRQDVRQ